MPQKRITVAPITYEYKDPNGVLSEPFELGDGVVITRVPEWLKSEEVMRDLGWPVKAALEKAKHAFLKEYEADGLGAEHDEALAQIRDCNAALWIARPSRISYRCALNVFFSDGDKPFRQQIALFEPIRPSPTDRANALTLDDLSHAKGLYSNMPKEGAVRTAIAALIRGLTEANWAMRYLVLWIGLEALFGPKDGREITYRISQRIAFFNGSGLPSNQKKAICSQAKECYSWRSRIVHGLNLKKLKPEKSGGLRDATEKLVRDALTRALSDPEVLSKLNGKEREQYLDGLVFSG